MYIKGCFTIIKFKELFSSPNSQFLSYQPFLVSFSFIAKALPCSLFGHYSTRNILTKICMQKPYFATFLVIPTVQYTMAIRVVEFSNAGTKLATFLPLNQHTQRKLLNFENWVMGRCQQLGIILENKVI